MQRIRKGQLSLEIYYSFYYPYVLIYFKQDGEKAIKHSRKESIKTLILMD